MAGGGAKGRRGGPWGWIASKNYDLANHTPPTSPCLLVGIIFQVALRPSQATSNLYMGVPPKIRGTLLGVPITRTIVFGGLYWGPLILGNYQMDICCSTSEASSGIKWSRKFQWGL